MTIDEVKEFLSAGTRTGKLGTVTADGRAHVAPIWFVLDGNDLVFTTGGTSLKAKAIRRDPRACICVDDEAPPFAFVLVDGTCEISDDPEEMLRWTTRIGGRYMGASRAEEYGRRNAVAGELLVRLTPVKVVARTAIAE